jgi:hypothetical protein
MSCSCRHVVLVRKATDYARELLGSRSELLDQRDRTAVAFANLEPVSLSSHSRHA